MKVIELELKKAKKIINTKIEYNLLLEKYRSENNRIENLNLQQ